MTDGIATIIVAAWGMAGAVSWWKTRRQQAELFPIARGRVCSKCGHPVRASQILAVTFDDERVDPSRALNECPCGELTVFDAAGGMQHVDPPDPAGGGREALARPAIGRGVRVLCGVLGVGFVLFAVGAALISNGMAALALLIPAFMLLSIALFATGPPAGAPSNWGRVRYQRASRLQVSAIAIGILGIGVSYLLSQLGVREERTSLALSICGVVLAIAMALEYVVIYYRHYAQPRDE